MKAVTRVRSTVGKLSLTALAVMLVTTVLSVEPASAVFPLSNGTVMFIRGGNLWYMDAIGGSDVSKKILNGPVVDAKMSADSTKLVYTRALPVAGGGVNLDIFMSDVHGGNEQQLTFNAAEDSSPSWSRDGTKIAFFSRAENAAGDIYLMTIADKSTVRLTSNAAADTHPDFSPDGTKIAFTSNRSGIPQIYILNADGSSGENPIQLTHEAISADRPSWRSTGDRITYENQTTPTNSDIATILATGGTAGRLTTDPAHDTHPMFGSSIFFVSDRSGSKMIYRMDQAMGEATGAPVKDDGKGPVDDIADFAPREYNSTLPPADFDDNGTTDVSVFRPSTGGWFVRNVLTTNWGASGDIPVPADYDGNGTNDPAVYRPSTSTWFVQGGVTTNWGTSGDIPVPGDYNGDGVADIAVFRPSTGTWFIQGGATITFGSAGDIPVPGRYNSDRMTDIAVYRPSTGTWFVRNGVIAKWGTSGDIPVPGDYDGNGVTDLAVYRPSTGTWFVRNGATVNWGTSGDIPVPGAYNGTGHFDEGGYDFAVYRPSTGTWFVRNLLTTTWGTTDDIPLPLPAAIRMAAFPAGP